MKEEVLVISAWKQTPDGLRFWVKSRPEIYGLGDNCEDAEDDLRDAVGEGMGIPCPVFEFDPPLPRSELQSQFFTPELFAVEGSCNPFEMPFGAAKYDLETQRQFADRFFQKPVCRKCGSATSPRNNRPLVVKYVDTSDDGAFGVIGGVTIHIFSARFLRCLTKDEKRRLQFRQVEQSHRSRVIFYELLGAPGPPQFGISGLHANGWRCGACGHRTFGYKDINIRLSVAKRDLPNPLPSLFTVGATPEITLCGTRARWRKLVGNGLRGLELCPIGVVPDNRLLSEPKLKRRYTGLAHPKGLTNLDILDLSGKKVTDAALVDLTKLSRLHSLDLELTDVTDAKLERLARLTTLQYLWLGRTKVTNAGLQHIEGLTNLQSLDLSDTKVTDAGLKHITILTSVQSLKLCGNQVNGAGLKHLKALLKLQTLDLAWTNVNGTGLKYLTGLPKLQFLVLMYTKVANAGLEHLKSLTNLRFLNLSGTNVTDAGVKKLQKALPNCKIIH